MDYWRLFGLNITHMWFTLNVLNGDQMKWKSPHLNLDDDLIKSIHFPLWYTFYKAGLDRDHLNFDNQIRFINFFFIYLNSFFFYICFKLNIERAFILVEERWIIGMKRNYLLLFKNIIFQIQSTSYDLNEPAAIMRHAIGLYLCLKWDLLIFSFFISVLF